MAKGKDLEDFDDYITIHFTANIQHDNSKRPFLVLHRRFFTAQDLEFLLSSLSSNKKLVAVIAFKDPLRAADRIIELKNYLEEKQARKKTF